MTQLVDDAQIYADMKDLPVTPADRIKAKKVIMAWTEALEGMHDPPDVRTIFLACISIIETAGPAYCRIAAATLSKFANQPEADGLKAQEDYHNG